jgi:predicted nucleotidyltransferase
MEMVAKKINTSEVIALLRINKDFLRSLKIKSIYLFGSYARNEQTDKSDVDLIVEFDVVPSLFEFVRVQRELSNLLGIKVDLVIKDSLKPRVAKTALKEALAI